MARWYEHEVPADTGLFTPLHLQPTAVCRLAFSASSAWLETHAISHRRLVAEHQTGLVIWSVQLMAAEQIGFFDTDRLRLRVTGRVRGGGTQLECEAEIGGGCGPASRMRACCIPLRLDDAPTLSGAPAPLGPEVMSAFLADEIDSRPHLSCVPGLRLTLAARARPLAQGGMPFVIHRHQCEMADQWFWPEAISLASSGREELIRTQPESASRLRPTMQAPLTRLDLLYQRPFYLFDEGAVLSTAYEWNDRLVFVHELFGAETGEQEPRAVAIEHFSTTAEPAWQ